jgi:AhpD family alkylhydroperoxidase
MRVLKRIWSHLKVLTSARRNRTDLLGALVRRPQLAAAVGFYESALLAMGRVDPELKVLATAKAAMVVNCEFCLDIGAALARHEGVSEDKLRALPTYADSPLFSDVEKLVIGYAGALSAAPALVPDDMRAELEKRFTRSQLAELTAEIAWENQRARFNQGLGVRAAGFSDGAFCLIPEPRTHE